MTKYRTNSSNYLYALLISLVLAVSGCANIDKNKRINSVDFRLNDFRQALRWGYYENALQFIQPKDYQKPLRSPEYLKNIRITSYEYGDKHLSEDGTRLDVTALISFYNIDQGTVKDIAETQIWWFDQEKKNWFLDGDIPDLTGMSSN